MTALARTLAILAMLCVLASPPSTTAAAENAANPPGADAADDDTRLPLLVFVGEKLSIDPVPDPCEPEPGEPLTCVSFDSLWLARYRIVERIAGETRYDEVAFQVADHYGFPRFGHARHALLYVTMAPDGPYLQKYQGIPVARVGEGGWAACGEDDDEAMPRAEPLQFLEPVNAIPEDVPIADAVAYANTYVGAPPDFVVDGRDVLCRRGVRVAALHRGLMEGVMRERGFPTEAGGLPPADEGAAPPAGQATRP